MKTFTISDIHGGYLALKQCLYKSGIDPEKDRLIVIGDVVDGWPETPLVIETLMKIKNLVFIMGNHDQWAFNWLETGARPDIWTLQGGQATIDAYLKEPELMAKHRDDFFKKAPYYFIDEQNRLYVHGGIPQDRIFKGIDKILKGDLMWDRSLADLVLTGKLKGKKFQGREFKEIYLGHTTTSRVSSTPVILENVILMDTGGGWEGKLSIMNVDTKEGWQSDIVHTLYPNHRGRR